jgi:hypothetical protein
VAQQPPSDDRVPGDTENSHPAISSAIARYLECVEDFFPYAATKLSLGQYNEHAGDADKYFPEELEMERAHLHQQLQGPIARAIYGSALVVLYSAFESTVMDFSRELEQELKCPRLQPSPKAAFPEQAGHHFAAAYGVDLFSAQSEKEGIELLRLLRNSFIHHQSSFRRLPTRIQGLINTPQSSFTKCTVTGDVWIPRMQCIRAYGDLIRQWAHALSQRVIARVGFDKYL